jgi:virginiamycin B lyase
MMSMARRLALLATLVVAGCVTTVTSTGTPATIDPQASTGCVSPTASPTCGSAESPTEPPETVAPSQVAGDLVFTTETLRVPGGAHPHDVAVASDGGIWYTGQENGTLGWLDPETGEVREARLPIGAAPHGVVTGPDGAGWVTDQGLNAIVRVTPGDFEVEVFQAPGGTSPHTPVFDLDGVLWFTGAGGWIGRLDPADGRVDRYPAPRGAGPYGITVTPSNEIWFVSLQQSYLGKVDKATGDVSVIEPPTANAGTRRVWSDSSGRLWISYWNAGMVAVYDPADESWREWDLPGGGNQAYSMYVDELDAVWTSDFGQNSVVRFDPETETFLTFESNRANAAVRQMLGRPGEAWGAESGVDRLVVFRYGTD